VKPYKILITPGEPAGIGPELLVKSLQQQHDSQLIACCDPHIIRQAAEQLGLYIQLKPWCGEETVLPAGQLWVIPETLRAPVTFGDLNPLNSQYVLDTLSTAGKMALEKKVDAIFTGPVHKGVINQAGIAFTGHTEFFAEVANCQQVVMMLATDAMRVALVTTHLPLKDVSAAITKNKLNDVLSILAIELHRKFGINEPKIAVLGLNPHAGEQGHMGSEELDTIIPVLESFDLAELTGPWPADTAFQQKILKQHDAVLAMYHDQGLPTLKFSGFGKAVNITLGLPFLRTSVDHGTALDIAGKGIADIGSFEYALNYTQKMLYATSIKK